MIDRSVLSEGVIAREIRGQVVFMSRANDDVLTLNDTASFIFTHLAGAADAAELSVSVMREFSIDDAVRVEREIRSLLESLRERGIVRAEAVARYLAG
jgi:hypothetical protein